MRIRKPFAAAFVVLLFIAASLGLAPNQLPQYKQSDKVLHFVTFFLITNGREFDPYDILANVVGSLLALLACSWYHKRMLERRRAARNYQIVPGEEQDVELGENTTDQETGVMPSSEQPANITEELDNWDENAEDWDDDQVPASSQIKADQEAVTAEKRLD
ncbi:hypothetical protein E4T39_06351 [Aureobasidium subglaciale]|nr:hypothetical protein E4T39_06351 [Aureobasidium subglaciale]